MAYTNICYLRRTECLRKVYLHMRLPVGGMSEQGGGDEYECID